MKGIKINSANQDCCEVITMFIWKNWFSDDVNMLLTSTVKKVLTQSDISFDVNKSCVLLEVIDIQVISNCVSMYDVSTPKFEILSLYSWDLEIVFFLSSIFGEHIYRLFGQASR